MKILCLDDDHARQEILHERWGEYHLIQVYNAEDAVKAIDEHGPFDVALLDHDLGGRFIYEDGIENTGMDVVRYLVHKSNETGTQQVRFAIVHTWNGARAPLMVESLRDLGCWVRYEPFNAKGTNYYPGTFERHLEREAEAKKNAPVA